MQNSEYLKERIKYLSELLKFYYAGFLLTGGGIGGLFINLDTPLKSIAFGIGLLIELCFAVFFMVTGHKIEALMEELEKEVENQ